MKTKQKKFKFSKGEINEKLLERQDLDVLESSASYIKNMISTPHGSIRSRDGTNSVSFVANDLNEIAKPTITNSIGNRGFGTGVDGEITVTSGTVNIEDIYEDENVTGVTTINGVDKGLNYGAGTYDPENDAYINATDFTINSGATLTHGTAYGAGASNKNGIVYIKAIGNIISKGTINLNELGGAGGAGGAAGGNNGADGKGSGYGHLGTHYTDGLFEVGRGGGGAGHVIAGTRGGGSGGVGGVIYGAAAIPVTTWADLYGSGGGGGGSSTVDAGRAGGAGGGSVRLYATHIDTSSGSIICNGGNGGNAGVGSGGGGGGSGGTVYIKVLLSALIGADKITCDGGAGGTGNPSGGASSVGRIYIDGTYTGSTSDPAEEHS